MIDKKTGDVFYFGEEVDMYVDGQNSSRSGAWSVHENNNLPGLIMPGQPVVGMKCLQKIAPRVVGDRAEVVRVPAILQSQVGDFTNCLIIQVSSNIQPLAIEYKTYKLGIGIVQDRSLLLVENGYIE